MRKKGAVTLIPKEIWGVLRAGIIILVLAVVIIKLWFFVNPLYERSKSSMERFQDVLEILDDGESRSVLLDFERGVWFFGFNKDQNHVEYRRTYLLRRNLEQSKPSSCAIDKACLCLCERDCKRVIACQNFDDIEAFMATDLNYLFNGGTSYEYEGETGNYVAIPGQGMLQVEVSREKDIVYLGSQMPQEDQTRQEFERLAEFAKQNIGERRIGTCKMIFEINQEKMEVGYFIIVYTDGNAKLFSGQGEQTRNIATQEVGKAAIISVPLVEDDLDQIFGDSYEEQMLDFIIDPYAAAYQEHQTGVTEGIVGTNQVTLIQRDGKWLWSRYDYDFIDLCE